MGPCKNNRNPELTGGAISLFEELIFAVKTLNINVEIIDTNKKNHTSRLGSLIKLVSAIFSHSGQNNVLFINSSNDYLILSLLLPFVKYKKIVLRKFGGEFVDSYNGERGFIEKLLCHFSIKQYDKIYLETKKLVSETKVFYKNVDYFPNVRTFFTSEQQDKSYKKNFVYIGRIYKEKGIEQIIKVANKLSEKGFVFDVYGPISEKECEKKLNENMYVEYKGVLPKEQVIDILKLYDVLLFPSEDETEGYPGIIIEALSQGLPVISAAIGGVPEMIINGVNGYLYPSKNIKELERCILNINKENYIQLSKNAKHSSHNYDNLMVTQKILKEVL